MGIVPVLWRRSLQWATPAPCPPRQAHPASWSGQSDEPRPADR